jgi:ATP-binding cassette subfamily B protein
VSTVLSADRILVLDGGRVAESGTVDELLARGGLFADLHRRQQLEREMEAL